MATFRSVVAGALLFVLAWGALTVLGIVLMLFTNIALAWYLLASPCPVSVELHDCAVAGYGGGSLSLWVWGISAVIFGWLTRGLKARRRFLLALPAILLVAGLLVMLLPVFGYRVYVDPH